MNTMRLFVCIDLLTFLVYILYCMYYMIYLYLYLYMDGDKL